MPKHPKKADNDGLAEMLAALRQQHRLESVLDLYERHALQLAGEEVPPIERVDAQRDTLAERATLGYYRREWTQGDTRELTEEESEYLEAWAADIDAVEARRMGGEWEGG